MHITELCFEMLHKTPQVEMLPLFGLGRTTAFSGGLSFLALLTVAIKTVTALESCWIVKHPDWFPALPVSRHSFASISGACPRWPSATIQYSQMTPSSVVLVYNHASFFFHKLHQGMTLTCVHLTYMCNILIMVTYQVLLSCTVCVIMVMYWVLPSCTVCVIMVMYQLLFFEPFSFTCYCTYFCPVYCVFCFNRKSLTLF